MSLLLVPVVVARVQCKPIHRYGLSVTYRLLSIQLIERFYDPLSGNVFLDDQPISELNVREYRKHLALVSQEPVSITHMWSLVF
jgi:ABC-type transport system involved in Fe-S cluster assembly fused permease/ATPase subunit